MKEQLANVWPNWEIVGQKGEGAFGKVYEIRRRDIGGEYHAALKVISIPQDRAQIDELRSEGMDEITTGTYFREMMEELVREFATLEKLKGNSNIVCYEDHEIVEHTETVGWDIYIRMELLTPLSQKLKEGMSISDVLRLAVDMCRALEICHDAHIIHRDIKPENVFVSQRGDYKLGDFGIARTMDKTVSNMSQKGTYGYMAPEVFRGEAYDCTVDIYSLGIVLYRLLNGNRLPFMPKAPQTIAFGDREQALQRRLGGEKMEAPVSAPKELADIVLKACAYRAEDRYRSAREMRIALERITLTTEEKKDSEESGSPIVKAADQKMDQEIEATEIIVGTASGKEMAKSSETSAKKGKRRKAAPQKEDSDTNYYFVVILMLSIIILLFGALIFAWKEKKIENITALFSKIGNEIATEDASAEENNEKKENERLASPKLVSSFNAYEGVKVTWEAVAGAENYRVMRKTARSVSWKAAGYTTETEFTDTTAESGKVYRYTVRCVSADGKTSVGSYDPEGLIVTYIGAPKLLSAAGAEEGVEIRWEAVAGAVNYRIMRKTEKSVSWKVVGYTTDTEFLDTTAQSGKQYIYTVRCVSEDGSSSVGSHDPVGLTVIYDDAP